MNNLEFAEQLTIAHGKVNNVLLTIEREKLTVPQLLTLGNIISSYPVKMVDVSLTMQYTGANLTCIADNLERKGLIKRIRSEVDRRVILLTPTEKGLDVFKVVEEKVNESLQLNAVIEEVKDLFNQKVDIL